MTGWTRTHLRALLVVYIVALVLSNVVQSFVACRQCVPAETGRGSVLVPAMTGAGRTDREIRLSYIEHAPPSTGSIDTRPPIILLHGSPGRATDFTRLGSVLASSGRRAFALDMPGFGYSESWVPDYSALACARYVFAFMDEVDIERAHVVGWSGGGAVALYMADLAPGRLAGITMLAAIGPQETEGSGNYYFEHAKYAVGFVAIVALPELVPHFGMLFPREYRHAFIRSFWDTDQRPLRGVMERLETPVLILHGRCDPLVADRAAERHHELIPSSRLVMTPYSHFMPFLQPEETAAHLEPFFARHDTPGVEPLTDTLDLAPRPVRSGFGGAFDSTLSLVRGSPWWLMAIVFAFLARLRRETATVLAGILVVLGSLDFGVAFLGLLVGRALHPREPWLKKDTRWLLGLPIWTGLSLLIVLAGHYLDDGIVTTNPAGFVIGIAGTSIFLNFVKLAPTHVGRRRIVANIRRLLHHEWWPSWLLYLFLIPRLIRIALKHRSILCWTCVNPGIKPGGGIVGESKDDILKGFNDPRHLKQIALDKDEPDRADFAREQVEADPALGGYPVIVKPDSGQRGKDVVLARTPGELVCAIDSTPGRVVVQRYHPGPVECGVFWMRDVSTVGSESTDTTQGRIFTVTRKVFPAVTGDGRRTLGRLILDHPRYNLQAHVYCENLADRLDEIPASGDRISLTHTGNHARGCRFEDGADLITPGLSEAIDRIARTWRGPGGEPFDFGRFDIRSSSEEKLKAGKDLAVIELNGVTSEATNLYDPSWKGRQALSLLARQWDHAFELGAKRRALGVRPMSVPEIIGALL